MNMPLFSFVRHSIDALGQAVMCGVQDILYTSPLKKEAIHHGDTEITKNITFSKESSLCVSINSVFVSLSWDRTFFSKVIDVLFALPGATPEVAEDIYQTSSFDLTRPILSICCTRFSGHFVHISTTLQEEQFEEKNSYRNQYTTP